MKKLICALATLALVMATYTPAKAEFIGTLPRNGEPASLTFTNNNTDLPMAVTVCYLDNRGVDVVMVEMVPGAQNGNGATVVLSLPRFGRATKRVIVLVDLPPGDSASASVMINGSPLSIGSSGSVKTGRLVFNVV